MKRGERFLLQRLCLVFQNYQREGMNIQQLSKGLNKTYAHRIVQEMEVWGLMRIVRVGKESKVYLTPLGKQIQHHVMGINAITGELDEE